MRQGNLCHVVCSVHFSLGSQMSSLQRRIVAITHTTANLIVQLRELDRLRERVRKAQLSARRSRRITPQDRGDRSLINYQNRATQTDVFLSADSLPCHAPRDPTTVGSGNRRVFSRIKAVQSASVAASRGPPTSRTAARDFYTSEIPVGKGAARDPSS
jgi:hypothetical protein